MAKPRKGAAAPFNAPKYDLSDSSDVSHLDWPTDAEGRYGVALVRMRRPDGSTYLLNVPGEHMSRVIALASGEFQDKTIVGKE
jgi:hypothetical protein